MQKKSIKIFSNCKNKHAKKKAWNNISRKDAEKRHKCKKRMQKKGRGVYIELPILEVFLIGAHGGENGEVSFFLYTASKSSA